jgi:hypothetical protein
VIRTLELCRWASSACRGFMLDTATEEYTPLSRRVANVAL